MRLNLTTLGCGPKCGKEGGEEDDEEVGQEEQWVWAWSPNTSRMGEKKVR